MSDPISAHGAPESSSPLYDTTAAAETAATASAETSAVTPPPAADEQTPTAVETASTPVNPIVGDHDRVQMLSLRADGTPDQVAPEIIGDKAFAEAAAKRQFAEQAVSAVDVAERSKVAGRVTIVGTEGDGPDEVIPATTDAVGDGANAAGIADLKATHDVAQAAAEAAAVAVVDKLHQG